MDLSFKQYQEWQESEVHKAFEVARDVVFAAQQATEKAEPNSDEWRSVYAVRCKLGQIEERLQYRWAHSIVPEKGEDNG